MRVFKEDCAICLVEKANLRCMRCGYKNCLPCYEKYLATHTGHIITSPRCLHCNEDRLPRYAHDLLEPSINQQIKNKTQVFRDHYKPLAEVEKKLEDLEAQTSLYQKEKKKINGESNDEMDNETADFFNQHCKQCPRCQARIIRVEGCSDMFCVRCLTPFDWNTLNRFVEIRENPDSTEVINKYRHFNQTIPKVPGVLDLEAAAYIFKECFRIDQRLAALRYDVHNNSVKDRTAKCHVQYLNKKVNEEEYLETLKDIEVEYHRRKKEEQILQNAIDQVLALPWPEMQIYIDSSRKLRDIVAEMNTNLQDTNAPIIDFGRYTFL